MHAELVIAGFRINMCDISNNVLFDIADEIVDVYKLISVDGRVITVLSPRFWTAMVQNSFRRNSLQGHTIHLKAAVCLIANQPSKESFNTVFLKAILQNAARCEAENRYASRRFRRTQLALFC